MVSVPIRLTIQQILLGIVSKFYGNNSIAEEVQRRLDGIEDDNITDMYEQ